MIWISWSVGVLAALAVAWPLVIYPLVLWYLARRRAQQEPDASQALPSMTVVLPTYREHANVAARLDNLRASYPLGLLQIVVVDSGSDDGTADAAARWIARHPDVETILVRQSTREGKASAINAALAVARGELVTVTDAPTRFEPEALVLVARRFQDPSVGLVSGHFIVTGTEGPVQREEKRFWEIRNVLRDLEGRVDSTPFAVGELCCFRRELVTAVDADTLADDMNLALKIRRGGRRVLVEPRARFTEPRTDKLRELLQTKGHRAAGGLQELLRARDMIFDRSLGLFGMLILPSAMLYYVPLRIPALALLAWLTLPRIAPWLAHRPGVAALVLFAGTTVAWRLRGHIGLLLLNEWLFFDGWRRLLSGKMDVRWAQERSTRQALVEKTEE